MAGVKGKVIKSQAAVEAYRSARNSEIDSIDIRFGAIAEQIDDQLKSQGYKMNQEWVAHFQADADAITRLDIRGLLDPLGPLSAKVARVKLRENIIECLKKG